MRLASALSAGSLACSLAACRAAYAECCAARWTAELLSPLYDAISVVGSREALSVVIGVSSSLKVTLEPRALDNFERFLRVMAFTGCRLGLFCFGSGEGMLGSASSLCARFRGTRNDSSSASLLSSVDVPSD